MEVSRVLVPVKGEKIDEDALRLACQLAHETRGTVYVLYVIQVARSLPVDAEVASASARGEAVLQHMEQLGKPLKCKLDAEMVQAREVGPAIVDEAIARDVQLIVLGMSYKERHGVFTLGDAVPYVLKHAPCRILVLREDRLGPNQTGPSL